jgi:hypothetical protein
LSYQKFSIRRKIKEDDPDLVAKINTLEAEFGAIKKYKDEIRDASVAGGWGNNAAQLANNVVYFQDQDW